MSGCGKVTSIARANSSITGTGDAASAATAVVWGSGCVPASAAGGAKYPVAPAQPSSRSAASSGMPSDQAGSARSYRTVNGSSETIFATPNDSSATNSPSITSPNAPRIVVGDRDVARRRGGDGVRRGECVAVQPTVITVPGYDRFRQRGSAGDRTRREQRCQSRPEAAARCPHRLRCHRRSAASSPSASARNGSLSSLSSHARAYSTSTAGDSSASAAVANGPIVSSDGRASCALDRLGRQVVPVALRVAHRPRAPLVVSILWGACACPAHSNPYPHVPRS